MVYRVLPASFYRKFQPDFPLWNMFKRFWRSVSNYGERPLMAVEEHRQNQVLNHGFIYAAGLYFVTYLVALSYFYFLLRADFPRYASYFWPFTATCLVPAAATIGLFFLRGRPGFSTIATIATYGISIVHNLAMLLFLGLSGGFQFFLAALIPAAYLAHPHRRRPGLPQRSADLPEQLLRRRQRRAAPADRRGVRAATGQTVMLRCSRFARYCDGSALPSAAHALPAL